MSAKDVVAFLKTGPIFAVLPTREIEALGAVAVEEAIAPATSSSWRAILPARSAS